MFVGEFVGETEGAAFSAISYVNVDVSPALRSRTLLRRRRRRRREFNPEEEEEEEEEERV